MQGVIRRLRTEPHLGACQDLSQAKSVHVRSSPCSSSPYLSSYMPGSKHDTEELTWRPTWLTMCLENNGFRARAPSIHRNLDPDKIQPKAVGKSPSQRVLPGDSCHAETPAKLSSHSTRIEQAPNLPDPLGVRKHYHNSPTLCQTTYMPRARHNRMDNTTGCVLCAVCSQNALHTGCCRISRTLVAMHRTYLCYQRTCVRYCCPPRSLEARNRPTKMVSKTPITHGPMPADP
jgi:hypothetical protein